MGMSQLFILNKLVIDVKHKKIKKKTKKGKNGYNWRQECNTYINKRNQANKICTQKKKKYLSNKITQTEENHRRNETKKFFEGLRNYKQVTLPIICKDAEDNVISQPDLTLERWKDYFCKILNIWEARYKNHYKKMYK